MIKRLFNASFSPISLYLLTSLYLLISCINLTSSYLYDWDEAIYAQVGKEMIAHKTIFGLWNGSPWLEKPPLVPFLSGILMKVPVGSVEMWARLPSFLAGLGVLYFLYKILKEKFEKSHLQYFAVTTVFLLLSSPFVNRITSLNTDIFLVFGWLGFYYYYKRSFVALTLFLFISVMSKSFLGFFPIFVVLAEDALVISKSQRLIRAFGLSERSESKDLGVKSIIPRFFAMLRMTLCSIAIPVVISLSWFFLAYLKFGTLFLKENLYDHLIARVIKPVELHYGGYLFYPKLLFSYYNVFLLLIIFSVCYVLYLLIKQKRTELLFIPLFLLYGVIISLAKTKLNWYIFPVLPFLAVSFSFLYVQMFKQLNIKENLFWIIALVIFVSGVWMSHGWTIRLQKQQPTSLVSLALSPVMQQCNNVAIIANSDEQKFYDVINAANVEISSTFRYGGSPSFRFYADQPVVYKYDKSPNRDIVDHTNCVIIPTNSPFVFTSKDWKVAMKKDGLVLYRKIN